MEFQQSGDAREGALGKERERVAIDRIAQHLAGIGRTSVSIESLHEVRAEPSQQHSRKWDVVHLPLDHKRKPRRQNRRENDTIQVAGVIGNHDRLAGRQPVQPLNNEPHAGERKEYARQRPRDGTAAMETGNNQHQEKGDQT